jgi:hypothetical protein
LGSQIDGFVEERGVVEWSAGIFWDSMEGEGVV